MSTLREPDLSRCPQCGGIADNGHDRSIPPNPYFCGRCMAQPVQEQMAQTRGEGNCHPPWRCACGANLYIDEYGYPASRAAPARKPVAWLQPRTVDAHSRPDLGYETCSKDDYAAFPVYPALAQEQAEPVQEPVAWASRDQVEFLQRKTAGVSAWLEPARSEPFVVPLHACPTQRRLTDDEIGRLWFQAKIPGLTETSARLLIRAAEEALRSKGAPA